MKKLLAIDTSTAKASIALQVFEKIFIKTNDNIKQHADYILPMIFALLKEHNVGLKDLDGIVFGCGPGSFTGIRVTCSVAKALGYAHDLPLYPVTSLQAIAYEANNAEINSPPKILALLDARMQEVYWQYFHDFRVVSPQVTSVANIVVPANSEVILAGPNVASFIDKLPANINISLFKDVFPTAASMIRLVQEGYIAPVTANLASPLYVRDKVVSGV